MSEARNVYPRLCWGCLGVIEDVAHDHTRMDYGGYCTDCKEHHRPYRPEIDVALRGRPERMNDVSEREELLKEVKMSEEDTHELATGGVIEETFFSLSHSGSVPWASQPPPPPWQRVGDPIIVSQSSTTGTHQYCPVCGKIKTYDAHGAYVDVSRIDWCTCESPHLTEERIRQIVTETMMRVLYPESNGAVTHEHRRTRQWDADGTEWRGVLYRVEREGE